jgi:hypothetical protein
MLSTLRGFTRWLYRAGHLSADPLDGDLFGAHSVTPCEGTHAATAGVAPRRHGFGTDFASHNDGANPSARTPIDRKAITALRAASTRLAPSTAPPAWPR